MEQTARDQLESVSRLPGVIRTVGLPDLHAGKSPVGMAFLSQGRYYPHLIGNDIGCGMGLFETGVKLKKYKKSKWVSRLNHITSMVTDNICESQLQLLFLRLKTAANEMKKRKE